MSIQQEVAELHKKIEMELGVAKLASSRVAYEAIERAKWLLTQIQFRTMNEYSRNFPAQYEAFQLEIEQKLSKENEGEACYIYGMCPNCRDER